MKKNAGFVLVTGMIFLVVITIIVVYLMRTSILEEKMARNSIDRERAVQAADAVLREAEILIAAGGPPYDPFLITGFSGACTSGLCKGLTGNLWNSGAISWSSVKTSSLSFNKISKPNYVIELLTAPVWTPAEGCSIATYRIVVKGVGQFGAESIVQSHYRIRPKKCH